MKVRIEYRFSSPHGDILLSPEDLSMPFLVNPSSPHPFLTLSDYFDTVRSFILKDNSLDLIEVPIDQSLIKVPLEDLDALLIRSEKHGSLYHISSVEIIFNNRRIKIAVSSALLEAGRRCMEKDYEILNNLNMRYDYSYIPRVFDFQKKECTVDGGREIFTMLSTEWLDNYHEWHLSDDNPENIARPYIWDMHGASRFATIDESLRMFREIAKILTLYYNTETLQQIRSWHHSAGDFVVKTGLSGVEIKLTTVRKYGSLPELTVNTANNRKIALIYFFLYITLNTRLDRVDGTGIIIWAHETLIDASIDGFFEGMRIKVSEGKCKKEEIEKTLLLLKSFEKNELKKIFDHLLILYQDGDHEEWKAIKKELWNHVNHLYFALQNFHL